MTCSGRVKRVARRGSCACVAGSGGRVVVFSGVAVAICKVSLGRRRDGGSGSLFGSVGSLFVSTAIVVKPKKKGRPTR